MPSSRDLMTILPQEPDIFPDGLLDCGFLPEREAKWSAVYTLSRREKEFMRQLRIRRIPHYGPLIPHRQVSPSGRVRTSYLPLFTSYVFVYCDLFQRQLAFETNCVSRWLDVPDGDRLRDDLRRLRQLMGTGLEIQHEPVVPPGTQVRVLNGCFQGHTGVVVRRQGETRLVIAIDFLQQGASVLLGSTDVEPVLD